MGCIKEPYDTYKEAIGAINAISKREKQGFRTYKCEHCGKFHITSIKKNKLEKKPKDKYKKQFINNKANQDRIEIPKFNPNNKKLKLKQEYIQTQSPMLSAEQAIALKRIIKNAE